MLFVDGENFTIRGQEFAKAHGIPLLAGRVWAPDSFLWIPEFSPQVQPMAFTGVRPAYTPVRAYYYTSVRGDAARQDEIRERLRRLLFDAKVFARPDGDRKAKGVDISLTKDALSHAFQGHYQIAVWIAGDGDYLPLVEELKRLGKIVCTVFFAEQGLSPRLVAASDRVAKIDDLFVANWQSYLTRVQSNPSAA
jgi:hypothetical protein